MFALQDYQQALLTPEQYFKTPLDVVAVRSLTPAQKMDVLKHWEANARDLDVARYEGMNGGGRSRLGEVEEAILALECSTAPQ